MTKEKSTRNKATLVITYNSVDGYPSGTYVGKNGPLVIYSHQNTKTWGESEAEGKLGQIMHGLYGRISPNDVDKIFLYVGLYAKEGALRAAKRLAGEGNKLTLVACDCDAREKERFAKQIEAPLIWADCGGLKTLREIVRSELA